MISHRDVSGQLSLGSQFVAVPTVLQSVVCRIMTSPAERNKCISLRGKLVTVNIFHAEFYIVNFAEDGNGIIS